MAENLCQNVNDELKENKIDCLECAVCLQQCIHPAELPCGHIFCFLCVKGFANQSKRCAMCRQEIPRDFLEHPKLVQGVNNSNRNVDGFDGGYQWFYEGRNGWWQYDERTSQELESAYKKGEKTCEMLIAGFLYIVDLENMLQLRRNDTSRRRKIKRDIASIPKKGIAGLRNGERDDPINDCTNIVQEHLPNTHEVGMNVNIITNTPANTPQIPHSNLTNNIESREAISESLRENNEDLQNAMDRLNTLRLDDISTHFQLNLNTTRNFQDVLQIISDSRLPNYNENVFENTE